MIGKWTLPRWTTLFLFLTVLARLHAQIQTPPASPDYKPSVGQSGKDVVWVPTPAVVAAKMLDLAHVTDKDFLIDLGSGDGIIVISAAKRGARALGIEFNPDMVALSRKNAEKEGVASRAQFLKADIFESDFSEATVITMFLLSDLNLRLRPKLLDLKPGTRIVSNTFSMGDWKADDSFTVEEENYSSYNTALLWIIPAKIAGHWQLSSGEMVLEQRFQYFDGTLKMDGAVFPITEGTLKGDQIRFKANGAEYSGQVTDKTMQGTRRFREEISSWNAVSAPLSNAPASAK